MAGTEVITIDRALLEGAYHALRSYQFGNASPNLAEEMADELERILDEESQKEVKPSIRP